MLVNKKTVLKMASALSILALANVRAEIGIQPFSFPSKIKSGSSVSATCLIMGSSDVWAFIWKINGEPVKGNKYIEMTDSSKGSAIFISPVQPEHAGNYTCTASGPAGKYTYATTLHVEAPPFWIVKPENKIVKLSETAVLNCSASGTPQPALSWKRLRDGNEEKINENKKYHLKDGVLVIDSVDENDGGAYLCTANNGIGEPLQAQIIIAIHVPARFEEKFVVMNTKRGDSAKLECNALGDQPLTVNWKKEKKQLSKLDSNRYEIFETLTKEGIASELVIRSAERDDGAMYTCTAENEFGKDERKIRVLVLEVPAPPLDVKVREVWTTSASVSWSAPYSGNSPITRYIAQYWRDQGAPHRLHEITVTSSQMSAMMKDLHPGTSYVVKIVADNEVGRGTPSEAVSLQTGEEEPTAPPVDITVEAKGPSTIRVTWKPPPKDHWNGQLKGYYVGYKTRDSSQPYSYKSVEFLVDSTQEYFLSNLARGTEYNVVVKAFNSAGSGPASHEAIARTSDGDLPPPPTVFVTSTSTNSITLRWNTKQDSPEASGYTVHYREEGGPWQELTILKPNDSTYTLNGLTSGTLYQIYLTGTTNMGRGDPSDLIAVKTEGGLEQGGAAGPPTPALMLDLSILIPVAASLVATIVVVIVACLCVHKIRQRQNLERAIAEQQIAYKGTIQRYVDIEKARLSGAVQGTLTSQNQIQMRDMMDDNSSKEEDNPEMKSFLPAQQLHHSYPRPYQHAPYNQRV